MFNKLVLYFTFLILLSQFSFSQTPVASFSASLPRCSGQSIFFSDMSTNSPSSWTWLLPGGTPSVSAWQNPGVIYPAPGVYSVTLIPANSTATGVPLTQTILVSANPTVAITPSMVTLCPWETATIAASGAASYLWYSLYPWFLTGSVITTPSVSAPTSYTLSGTSLAGCTDSVAGVIIPLPLPGPLTASYVPVCILNTSVILTNTLVASTYSWSTGNTTPTVIVSPSVSQNYTCYTRAGNSCKVYLYYVDVAVIPTITASSATICPGAGTAIFVSGATNYTWNPTTGVSNPFIAVPMLSPGVSTNYTITGQTTGACISSTVVNVMVAPSPTLSGSSATMCAGESRTLCVSGGSNYVWYGGTSLSSYTIACPVASPSSSSTYSVLGRNQFLCFDTLEIKLQVDACTGLSSINSNNAAGFKLFPNPNNGKFFIEPANNQLPAVLRIYTTEGALITEKAIGSDENTYSLNLKPGIYFLQIVQSDTEASGFQKFVVIRD